MAETSGAIDDIKNLKPPVLDHVTYLVLLEERLCLEILPALNEVLSNDEQLTQQIGWDLVHNLSSLPGSEACLETIARIGNPREIILKTLQSLDWIAVQCHVQAAAQGEEQEDSDDLPPQSNEGLAAPTVSPTVSHTQKFLALLSMLAILHRRIRTKHPSRFLVQTLQTVLRAYRADQQMTASVINLVRNLSGRRRPPLPTRKSSVHVANPDQDGDASRNVPDPEADAGEAAGVDPAEAKLQEQLLLCFVTCVLEQYVNKNKMAWAVRLLEHYEPEKIPPGKKTTLEAFREDQELLTRDAIVGTLAVSRLRNEVSAASQRVRADEGCIGIGPGFGAQPIIV